jgi:catechol 2,3-dioxygenase-like lactoylglutathione lyase family enzyme
VSVSIQRIMHVNANCSRLERSLAFYREVAGLEPLAHTRPVPQDGAGFGLEGRIQWDAHILHDDRGHAGPALDLLEWQQPAPTGRPHPEPQHLGIARLGLLTPDADAAHARALAAGASCLSTPRPLPVAAAAPAGTRAFLCRDPDGCLLQLAEHGVAPRLSQVSVNCSDLSRSAEWYERVLGLPPHGGARPGPQPGGPFGLPGEVEWESLCFGDPGRSGFALELCQWRRPAPLGPPYPAANHLGLYRMAFLVEDAAACHAELGRLGVTCGAPVWLDMGPDIPIDGLWALFFADPDGACLELIQTPVVS